MGHPAAWNMPANIGYSSIKNQAWFFWIKIAWLSGGCHVMKLIGLTFVCFPQWPFFKRSWKQNQLTSEKLENRFRETSMVWIDCLILIDLLSKFSKKSSVSTAIPLFRVVVPLHSPMPNISNPLNKTNTIFDFLA